MKNLYFVLIALCAACGASAQLTGVKTIRSAGGDYASFGAAITALNSSGVGTGGVVFNVESGFTSTEDSLIITATGTAANPITFQKSGTGTNPVIRPTGSVFASNFTVKIAGGDYITFDGIDISISTGSAMEWGYVLEGSSTNGCRFNTIKNCSITLSKVNTTSRGIYSFYVTAPTAATNTNSENKFYNINIQNSYNGYFLNGNSTYPDQNNEIGTTGGGTATLSNIGGGTITSSIISIANQQNINVYGQRLINNSNTTGQLNGIISTGTNTSAFIYNNTIRNLSTTAASTSTVYAINTSGNNINVYNNIIDSVASTTGPAAGINASGSGTNPAINLYGNNIQRVITTGTSALNSAFGVTNSGAGVALQVYRNYISNITNMGTSTTGVAAGLNVSGTNARIYNNFISDVKAWSSTAAAGSRALVLNGGTSNFYVYHNSVYLNHLPQAAGTSSAAVYLAASAASFDLRNNIFVNMMDNSGGGRAVALYAGAASYLTKMAAACNSNLYFAGTPSANNLLYYDGTNSDQSLQALQLRMGVRDQQSISEMPPFVSISQPYNLHLQPGAPTQCERGGQLVGFPVSVATDYDGDARSGLFADIGADEGNFSFQDLTGPYITYTPLNNTTLSTSRTLNATILDPSGVPTVGAGLPVLYWKVNSSSVFAATTGSTQNGTSYSFSFGAGVVLSDSVTYYIVAQDDAAAPNTIAGPSAGASGYTINPPAAATAPILPNTYKVVAAMPAVVYVGAGQTYTSLTGAEPNGVFAAINKSIFNGNVDVRVTSDLVEDGTVELTQWLEEGVEGTSVSISPASAAVKMIAGNSLANGNGLIRLSGVKRARINGAFNGSGNYLTFRSTGEFLPTFMLYNDASRNSIRNCTIEGGTNSTQIGVLHFGPGTVLGNDADTVANCIIRDRSDITAIPLTLVYSGGTSDAIANSNNIIADNKLYNFGSNAFSSVGGGNENWTITGNEMYQSKPVAAEVFAINFGSKGTNLISRNSIHDLQMTRNGMLGGILLQNALNTTVSKNRIYNFPDTSGTLGGIVFFGSNGNPAMATLVNNQITISPKTTTQGIYGIVDNSFGGNTLNVYNNTIYIGGTENVSTGASWAYLRQPASGASSNTIRNNIFFNGRKGRGNHYALGDEKFGSAATFITSNNLYLGNNETNPAQFMDRSGGAATPETFAAWVAATHDISSYAENNSVIDPAIFFASISTGNLAVNYTSPLCWYVNGKALPLAGVGDDFSSAGVRSTTLTTGAADIGSYEFTATVPPPALTVNGSHTPGGTETFEFGGRTLATITWGAASAVLPALGTVRHHTGEWPNDPTNNGQAIGARYLNEWWDIPATGGSDFNYNIKLYYDSAMLGTVPNEASMVINKKQSGVPGTWITVTPTALNTYDKIMSANGLANFSEFTGSDMVFNLPVSLLYFNGKADKDDALLNWETTVEKDHRSFELERSPDGRSFTKIAAVDAKGAGSGAVYNVTDAGAMRFFSSTARLYYRLKMISTSGQVTYSQVVVLRPVLGGAGFVQAIAPNPFSSQLQLQLRLPAEGMVWARLLDVNGRTIIGGSYQLPAGANTVQLGGLDRIANGMYMIEMQYNGERLVQKVMKQ